MSPIGLKPPEWYLHLLWRLGIGKGSYTADNGEGSDSISVALSASESHIGTVTTPELIRVVYTRAAGALAYTANECIRSVSGTPIEVPGSARVAGGTAVINRVTCWTNVVSQTERLRLHWYSEQVFVTIAADSASWIDVYADAARQRGFFDLPALSSPADIVNGNCSRCVSVPLVNNAATPYQITCASGSTSAYLALETLDAFTGGASQAWAFDFEIEQI